jgi:hypothetical protein
MTDVSLSRTTKTLTACRSRLDEIGRRLPTVLNGAGRWNILKNTLSLYDAATNALALLEAIYTESRHIARHHRPTPEPTRGH